MESRFATLESRITAMEARFDRRFEAIEAELKEFFRVQAEHDQRIRFNASKTNSKVRPGVSGLKRWQGYFPLLTRQITLPASSVT